MNTDYKKIGEKIKAARKKANVTREQLADMISTSTTTLGKIEGGENVNGGSVDLYVRIAVALHISLDSLFDIETAQKEQDMPDEQKFEIIQRFIDISGASFMLSDGSDPESYSMLKIPSLPLSFYLQEHFRVSEIINKTKEMEYMPVKQVAVIKKALLDNFNNTMREKFTFEGNEIKYAVQDFSLDFYYDSDIYSYSIVEMPIPQF